MATTKYKTTKIPGGLFFSSVIEGGTVANGHNKMQKYKVQDGVFVNVMERGSNGGMSYSIASNGFLLAKPLKKYCNK